MGVLHNSVPLAASSSTVAAAAAPASAAAPRASTALVRLSLFPGLCTRFWFRLRLGRRRLGGPSERLAPSITSHGSGGGGPLLCGLVLGSLPAHSCLKVVCPRFKFFLLPSAPHSLFQGVLAGVVRRRWRRPSTQASTCHGTHGRTLLQGCSPPTSCHGARPVRHLLRDHFAEGAQNDDFSRHAFVSHGVLQGGGGGGGTGPWGMAGRTVTACAPCATPTHGRSAADVREALRVKTGRLVNEALDPQGLGCRNPRRARRAAAAAAAGRAPSLSPDRPGLQPHTHPGPRAGEGPSRLLLTGQWALAIELFTRSGSRRLAASGIQATGLSVAMSLARHVGNNMNSIDSRVPTGLVRPP